MRSCIRVLAARLLGAVLEESDAFYEKAMDTLLGQVCMPKEPCERAKSALQKSPMRLQRDLLTDILVRGARELGLLRATTACAELLAQRF